PPPTLRMRALQLFAILCLGLYVLNLGYGFDGTFERLGSYRFVSRALSGQAQSAAEAASGANRFSDTWLAEVPLPVPRDFLSGLDIQRREFEQGKWSYLRGEWKHGGWWWYYLYAAMIKEPLGTWLLIAIAVIAAWRNPAEEQSARDTLILLAPGLLVLLLVSSQTGFNRYLRYALPAFPFFFIWASQAVRLAASAPRRWSLPVAAALLWSVASSLWIYPHSLSYFNEAVGGPSGGHRHLIDANIDWGQDLYRLRDWLQAHPDRVPLRAACQAFVPLDQLGVTFGQVPASPESGWFIISRHDRHRRDGAFAYFELIEPVDRIGESMDVYHITEDAAEKIRRAIESASR
ncbi:MAG: hypothetical protein KF861_13180, partial [Planctomycetaceae bacterium]|nr:hypothetical protein [Planctomycetaceae bacterium]